MEKRIKQSNSIQHRKNVLYIMKRDFRIQDNHSVILGYEMSEHNKSEFYILINPNEYNKNLNTRQKVFMRQGINEILNECENLNIHVIFNMLFNEVVYKYQIDCIITEESPLREAKLFHSILNDFCIDNRIALYFCDSHNIVPSVCLNKYIKSAKVVKENLYKYWPIYLSEFPVLKRHRYNKLVNNIPFTYTDINDVSDIDVCGGYTNGMKEVNKFIEEKFHNFKKLRNQADFNNVSNLQPWILSGQIGSQSLALYICKKYPIDDENTQDFLNEIFIWKETAEHFCRNECNYDNLKGASTWAVETLDAHKNDKRSEICTEKNLEKLKTKNIEWNAGMNELKSTGRMHLYVFIYWCKHLLFMTKTPEEALKLSFSLYGKYSLEANYPYSILWIMYSICGVMDQGFGERNVIGKIRYIKSIKAPKYISMWSIQK
ncbi:deoxyribodipyrimidine photolyase [Edhazardia aedis USNM 41457]|uniref:Deoxyribodipyrimidine photolyase n=1 Tax=Edhazardia aedis (strain USNM 41457) TaxID=1003232 RepID=J9DCQ2_EDHAE|nr:deoxyribodipyrimidine photolyase [Edhazardia aedis USNM 41457]|eukprot:EJW05244.1 deoxyribodipyrimidine photolyase [Edhazardia aedis USNM 41457]